jgi:hypothetical protein
MPETTTLPSYGSLKVSTDEEDEYSFQEAHTYYLKPSPLSRKEKLQKLLLLGVPILAAVIIIGGAASLLFKDFDNLYPGPGGSGRPYPSPSRGKDTEPASSPMHNAPQPGGDPKPPIMSGGGGGSNGGSSPSSGSAACASNEKCAALDLIGNCCPTAQGIMLGCC